MIGMHSTRNQLSYLIHVLPLWLSKELINFIKSLQCLCLLLLHNPDASLIGAELVEETAAIRLLIAHYPRLWIRVQTSQSLEPLFSVGRRHANSAC
jgi:hypothetical protein